MSNEKHHIVPYKTYFLILLALVTFTFASVGITSIELGKYTVVGALLFSMMKTFLVLTFFMHLKYDKLYIKLMVTFVFAVFVVTILITFIDYLYR
ncbi:MAG TPA: cytochrome C oxidase subunit IV family protein [Draconibacterium sp.]|nr:cytochrome C oxidase subunit IV family protein [Draconibacterium sp.]